MPSDVTIVYVEDKAAMAKYTSWRGPVGRDLNRRLRTVELGAKMTVGVKTGKLRRSIKTVRHEGYGYLVGSVGSWTRKYARFHHEGTRPHLIRPRKPGGVLRFSVQGRVVFTRLVRHPGTRPNHYLTRWLREAVK